MTTYRIFDNVTLGEGSVVEDFCIVGTPPRGMKDGELATTIGAGAVLRSHTVMYAGNVIGANFQTGNKVNIRESNRIGNNVSVGTLSVIEHHVEIADNVRIHTQVFIPEYPCLKRAAGLARTLSSPTPNTRCHPVSRTAWPVLSFAEGPRSART